MRGGCKEDEADVSSGVTCNLGTASGLISDFTMGGTLLGEGNAGDDAHSAALVNCVIRENDCDDLDVVRKAFFSFDLILE